MAGRHIFVVNDDLYIVDFMRDLLRDEGYPATFSMVGETAYELIRDERPDLVILDIRMEQPDSGLRVLEMVRLDRRTARIPVIVCSADHVFLRTKADHLRTLACDVLEKPFTIEALLDKIASAIGPPGRVS